MFNIINCKYTLQYQDESNTGRCRLAPEVFASADSKLTVGCVVKIRLYYMDDNCVTILCAAWPSTINDLPIDSIVVDETVVFGNRIIDCIWTDCKGEVSLIKILQFSQSLSMILINCV